MPARKSFFQGRLFKRGDSFKFRLTPGFRVKNLAQQQLLPGSRFPLPRLRVRHPGRSTHVGCSGRLRRSSVGLAMVQLS